jgi:hypothetical protein
LSHQKKGKSITIKYVKKKEHVYSCNDDLNNEDIALIARKFMFKKKNNGKDKNGKDFAKRN